MGCLKHWFFQFVKVKLKMISLVSTAFNSVFFKDTFRGVIKNPLSFAHNALKCTATKKILLPNCFVVDILIERDEYCLAGFNHHLLKKD